MEKFCAVLKWTIPATVLLAAFYAVGSIANILAQGPMTSFPWWSGLSFAALYFGPVLAVEIVVYLILRHRLRK